MIFVIGATGKVGRHLVPGLLESDAVVRALVRDPDAAGLPTGVDVVPGDLSDPHGLTEDLDGVEAVFLLWPFLSGDGAAPIVDMLARNARRIVYLSAEAAGRAA